MLNVSVISPEATLFEGEAPSITAPAFDGEIGILTALGTRAWQIIAIFVSQAGIVALVFVLFGLAASLALPKEKTAR